MILAAFRVRSFRFQWPADLLASWAFEMETLILGWFVLVQSGSVLVLTVFGSLQYFGTLAAPMFGVLADRAGNRAVLCALRAACVLFSGVLMTLGLAGGLAPAPVLVVAALAGLVRPNDLVMRNSLIGATIPSEHLMGALGLSRATADSARIAGALAGASLLAALGTGAAYVVVTLFYVASLALTFGVARERPVPDPGGGGAVPVRGATHGDVSRPSGWREMADGLAYVWATPRVLAAMWLAFLVNLTAYPFTGGLLPYVARAVYQTDARGLGWLLASFSAGALVGSIAMIVTGGARRTERAMLVTVGLWYALLLVFGHVSALAGGIALLALAGVVQSVAMIGLAGSLLRTAGARFRARVMGVRTLAVYGLPVGLMAAGVLIDRLGYPATVSLYCGIGLACAILIGVRWRAHVWE